jgi:hypothetical protein
MYMVPKLVNALCFAGGALVYLTGYRPLLGGLAMLYLLVAGAALYRLAGLSEVYGQAQHRVQRSSRGRGRGLNQAHSPAPHQSHTMKATNTDAGHNRTLKLTEIPDPQGEDLLPDRARLTAGHVPVFQERKVTYVQPVSAALDRQPPAPDLEGNS